MVEETQMPIEYEEFEMTEVPEEEKWEAAQINGVPIVNDVKIEAFTKLVMR